MKELAWLRDWQIDNNPIPAPVGAAFAPLRSIRATMGDVFERRPSRATLDARCQPTLSRLGLPLELLDRNLGSVSGGELQRLSLARVLLRETDLLFADEPTSRLDAVSQWSFMKLLGDAAGAGHAVLLASHDADILRAMADQLLTLGGVAGSRPTVDATGQVTGEVVRSAPA